MESNFTLKEMERMDAGLAPWESMSFACGGWLQFYMFGVGKALQESGMDKGVTYCGSSAGSLTATGLALGGNFDEGHKGAKSCIPIAYSSPQGLLQLHKYVGENVDKTLSPYFTVEKASSIQIAATSLPYLGAGRLKDFPSASDLKDAILASCAAFPAATTQVHRGVRYADGGLTDFQPVINDETVTVSPFYFSLSDIKPSRYVPLWWAFMPPSEDAVDWLYTLGYEDCLEFLEKKGILAYMDGKVRNNNNNDNKQQQIPKVESSFHTSPWSKLMTYATGQKMDWSPAHLAEVGKISMRRFLGYDLRSLTNNYVSFAMDLILLVLLIVVWKPLALTLIYLELLCRIVYLNVIILLKASGVYSLLSSSTSESLYQRGKSMAKSVFPSTFDELNDCVWCVLSLSLALRFFSGRPTPSVALRKHDRLLRSSLLYRVFRHMI